MAEEHIVYTREGNQNPKIQLSHRSCQRYGSVAMTDAEREHYGDTCEVTVLPCTIVIKGASSNGDAKNSLNTVIRYTLSSDHI